MVLCMVGTGMLWVGWYGFNAGSALGADAIASNAFATTTLAAATAGFVWGMAEWILRGHPSVLGFCSGIVGGLVVITPAAGFVNTTGAMVIGVIAGVAVAWPVTHWLASLLFGVEPRDALTIGVVITLVFASALLACLGPARRALGIDPTMALRAE